MRGGTTLADQLAEHWSTLARAMLSRRLSESLYGAHGTSLSPGRRQAILLLEHGELRMGELARRLDLDDSTITRLVDRLEGSGLAERQPADDDRRAVAVALTDEGARVAAGMRASRAAFMAEVLDLLEPDERVELVALLGKVGAAMGEREAVAR
jgi:DNA-binding MarR family transcriptional regulator